VAVVLYEAASSLYESVLAEIQGFASPKVLLSIKGLFHLKVNQLNLKRIAALNSMQAIEKALEIKVFNDQIKVVARVNAVNEAIMTAKQTSLTGTGQVVAIVNSNINSAHNAFKAPDKIVVKRLFRIKADGTKPDRVKPDVNDTSAHGTHVAGTVAGLPIKDWESHDITGVAPNAQLAVIAVMPVKGEKKAPPLTRVWYDEVNNIVPGSGICRIINNL
jgi:subtilisin family serine protease